MIINMCGDLHAGAVIIVMYTVIKGAKMEVSI